MSEPVSHSARSTPSRKLNLFDSICIIVGIIIGAGIYETTPFIASNVGSPGALFCAWLIGGLVASMGAVCYTELATTYPWEGGDYVYLTRAFGSRAGFLFAWCEYWIIRPGNVGMMAFVFARFAHDLLAETGLTTGREGLDFVVYASTAILTLTFLNLLGVRSGKTTQNLLSAIKVVGLIAVFGVALALARPEDPQRATAALDEGGDFRLALILVLFTYGGWNELSYVAAEIRHPERNIGRALFLGVGVVTGIYLAINLALLAALGLAGATQDTAVVQLLEIPFGVSGRRAMSLLVCLSCLGSINGMLFTGSRVFYAVGTEHRLVRWLGRWSGRLDAPVRALVLQSLAAVGLVVGFGGEQGFQRLLIFTAPVFWFFAFMVGISLFVLRWRDQQMSRPHPVRFYPWVPLFFCLSCAFMFDASFTYALQSSLARSALEEGWTNALLGSCILLVVLAGAAISSLGRTPSESD